MKIKLIALLLVSAICGNAQQEEGTWAISLGAQRHNMNFFDASIGPKIQIEINPSEFISLNYSLSFSDGYFKVPGASPLFAGAKAAEMEENDSITGLDVIGAAIVGLFIPEGLTFHLPIGERASVSPSINPLCWIGARDQNNNELIHSGAFELGAHFRYYVTNGIFLKLGGGYLWSYWEDHQVSTLEFSLGFPIDR